MRGGQKIPRGAYKTAIVFALLSAVLCCLNGCALISLRGKWGYINRQGEWVVTPRFDRPPGQFRSGIAPVPMPDGWRFIDKSGRVIDALPKSDMEPFEVSDGLILCVRQNPKKHRTMLTSADFTYVYMDTKGHSVLVPAIVTGGKFSEGLAGVQFPRGAGDTYSMWGYIDKEGKRVIDGKFFSAQAFAHGLAVVEIGARFQGKGGAGSFVDGKFGFIDRSGQFVIKPAFRSARAFGDNGLAVAETAYIDRTGSAVLKGPYWHAGDFSEGVAPVGTSPSSEESKFGFIDRKGNWVAPAVWDWADSFSEGLAGVGTNTGRFEDEESRQWPIFKCGFVDRSFKLVIPQKFLAVRRFFGRAGGSRR